MNQLPNHVRNLTTSPLQQLWRLVRPLVWAALWLLGLGALLLYPVRWLFADRFDPVRLINYVVPWLLLFLIPALVVAALARRKWLPVILAAPVLATILTYAPLFLPQPQNPPDGRFSLKIASHNLYHRGSTQAIVELLRQEQPDILLLQELTPELAALPLAELVRPGLADIYPELYADIVNEPETFFVQAIFSRYPLRPAGAEVDKGRLQKVLADTPAGQIPVWNVHLYAPFRVPPPVHDAQARALLADIMAVQGPLIAGGDFNAAEHTATYRLVSRYLYNAHWQTGWGFGFSFPAPPHTVEGVPLVTGPLYRIDHIFYNDSFAARRARTLAEARGSDHLPVVAELVVVKPLP